MLCCLHTILGAAPTEKPQRTGHVLGVREACLGKVQANFGRKRMCEVHRLHAKGLIVQI